MRNTIISAFILAAVAARPAGSAEEVKLPPGVKMPPPPRVWRAPPANLTPPPAEAGWAAEWTPARPLPLPLAGHAAVVSGRHIYVVGGVTGREHLGQRDVWRTKVSKRGALGKWKKTKPLAVPMGFTSVVLAGGRIYVIGGSGRIGMQHIYDKVYSAQVKKRGGVSAWREETSLPDRLVYPGATACGGFLYVLGGFNGQEYRQVLNYARIGEDGSLGEWKTADALYPHPIGRTYLTSVGVDLLVVGGLWYDSQGEHVSSLVLRGRREPDGNVTAWDGQDTPKVAAGPLRYSLADHAGVTGEKFVYVMGGSGPDSPGVPTTQANWVSPVRGWLTDWQFGPKLRRFRELGGPQDARLFHTAAALVGRHLFVLGGYYFVRQPTDETQKMELREYAEPAWLKARRARASE